MSAQRKIEETHLSNGVRVITESVPELSSVSVGIWVDVGSRDELIHDQGCSHFLEHLLFKGTEKRTAQEISTVIEARGGYLNAFTDKDMTCFHVKVLAQDLELAVDVLSDIIQRPLIKQEDIEKELHVVFSEIDARDDDPGDLIHDLYFETAWGRNTAAHPILGSKETLQNMDRRSIRNYYLNNYTPDRMVVTSVGAISHEKTVDLFEDYLKIDRARSNKTRSKPKYKPRKRYVKRASNQVQVAMIAEGLPQGDESRDALTIINSYLGVGASSELFQEVREKQGLAYSIFTTNYSLQDSGLFTILAGTKDKYVEKLLGIEFRELEKLCEELPEKVLEKMKHKSTGLFVIRSENPESRMMNIGVSALRQGHVKTMQEVIDDINQVSIETVQCIADKMFEGGRLGLTTLGLSKETEKKIRALF
jgi:predicted Zn-dependent peptidase